MFASRWSNLVRFLGTGRIPASVAADKSTPSLSVIVVVYRMKREAPRTLFSLTTRYQGVAPDQYEVIVVENPSDQMLDPKMVESFGPNFRYMTCSLPSRSPAPAINLASQTARGENLMLMVDGARILSPGVLKSTLAATRVIDDPTVATLSWHLGPANQAESIKDGYCQEKEDSLLSDCRWQRNGYRLFSVSALAGSSAGGWFSPLAESNCITVSRRHFDTLKGYSERFTSSGGGLVNLDFYRRAVTARGSQLVILLGEGTFHQIHGGVATNRTNENVLTEFFEEYERVRGRPFQVPRPALEPIYLGALPESVKPFLPQSTPGKSS